MSGLHARYSPSSAHRIIDCPASLQACDGVADDAGYEAVEGTVAHWLHEEWLLTGKRPTQFLGKRPWSFIPHNELTSQEWQLLRHEIGTERDLFVDEGMLNYVEESVLWCREVPGDHFIEKRVNISPWCPIPDQFGTADHFACQPGKLVITDFKYGRGVQVYAERNYQAILYALGVINEYDWEYDFDEVVIRIAQPRLGHFDVWETTKAELLQIGEFIKERFAIAHGENPPFGPTEQACKFCRVSYKCKALADKVLDYFDFEEDASRDDVKLEAEFLTLERAVEIFKMRGLFKLWIGAVEADIATRLSRDPDSVPGLKLVAGRSVRYWPNPDKVRDDLALYIDEDKLYKPREMISPAQAEKLLSKGDRPIVSVLADKKPGKPTIVDADDPRPKWEGDNAAVASSHFDDESDD